VAVVKVTGMRLRAALNDGMPHSLPAGIAGSVEVVPDPDRNWWVAEYRVPGRPTVRKRFMSADNHAQAAAVAREVIAWVRDDVGHSGLDLDP